MNKLGKYIEKLMTAVLESKTGLKKGQEKILKDLAMGELKRLNINIEEFLKKHEENDEKNSEITVKQLLQEAQDVKDK